MSEAPLIRHSLTDFFHDLLLRAMRAHEVQVSALAERYVVGLLERYATPPSNWDSRPLALDYLESFHHPHARRWATLKQVGDSALFLSGIFMEHLERRLVPTDYYMGIGAGAYGQLAHLRPPDATAPRDVFAEIASRFPDFVRVLSEISFAELFRSDAHTVRIYTRWLRTRGAHDAQWLLRNGIVPFDPGVKSRH